MKIWLDDIRPAPEGWIWCKTYNQIFTYLEEYSLNDIEEISFDHDLGDDLRTGYDVLNWIEQMVYEQMPNHLPIFHIHSANPVGRKNMERAIESIKKLAL